MIAEYPDGVSDLQNSTVNTVSEKKIYNYSISEFHDDIRFVLVDQAVSVMFVFTNCVWKCIMSKNSLILDDKSVELDSYSAELIETESLIAAFENETNCLVILDYQLERVRVIEGVKGPSFLQSMSWTSSTSPETYGTKTTDETEAKNIHEQVLWLKGNHQAALVNVVSGEEISRAPLFGTVNSYSEHVPLLAAYSAGTFMGFGFELNDFWLTWVKGEAQKVCKPINQAIPEARNLLSLHLTQSGGYAVCLLSSSRELSQSTVLLAVFALGDSLRLLDYRRVGAFSPDFLPRLNKSPDARLYVLNLGQKVEVFAFSEKQKRLELLHQVEGLAAEPISWVSVTSGKRELRNGSALSAIVSGSNPSARRLTTYALYLFPRSSTGFCRIDVSVNTDS